MLIIDQIGKDISGAGMDPNVTGRTASGEPGFDEGPPIGRIVARNLTDKTEGNATGVGVADVSVVGGGRTESGMVAANFRMRCI